MLVQWWEGELERGYMLYKARRLTQLRASMRPWANYSRPADADVLESSGGAAGQESRQAVLTHVLHDLPEDLFTELLAAFHIEAPASGRSRYDTLW